MFESIVASYLQLFPGEADRLKQFKDLLAHNSSREALTTRHNFVGHITASGIIVSRNSRKVLLIHHKSLAIYLQPGGHINSLDKTPLEAARREVKNETGLEGLKAIAIHADPLVPIDIDTHSIPESMRRGEPRHWHHDFRYLFLYDGPDEAITIEPSLFNDYRWVDVNELGRTHTLSAVCHKLQLVFSAKYRHRRFYSELIQSLEFRERPSVVVVAHILPDVDVYLAGC